MNIQSSLIAVAAGAFLSTSVAFATDKPDQHFLQESIQGNLAEQRVGHLAEQKGASQEVKDFGAMLAKDHGDANEKAQQAAASLGVTAPTKPSVKERAMFRELSMFSGDNFDKHFIKAMVKDHQEDIAKYQKEADSGSGPAADYAKAILPGLHKHLEMAQRLQQQERSASASDNTKMK